MSNGKAVTVARTLSLGVVVWAMLVGGRVEASEPLRIGIVLPMSGSHKALGRAVYDGIEWARESTQGIQLELRDTRGTEEGAAQAVNELAQDPGVLAIIGPIGAKESAAAARAAQDSGIPLLALTGVQGVEDTGRFVFRLRVSPEEQADATATFAVDALAAERAAVFYPDDEYGTACMRSFVEAFTAAGGYVTALESYPLEERKLSREAELLSGKRVRKAPLSGDEPSTKTARRSRPNIDFDLLYLPAHGADVPRALAFLKTAGVPLGDGGIQLMGTSTWGAANLAGTEGLANGAMLLRVFDSAASDAAQEKTDQFFTRFEREPTELEAQSHDALELLVAGFERCAEPSRLCVLQGIQSSRIHGVSGPLRITGARAPSRELLVFEVDGSGELWPAY